MKTTLLVLCLFVICFVANANKTPPAAVSKTFAEKFRNAEKVKWSMEEATEWEAEFKMNGKEASASFDLSGKWLETEIEIEQSELPAKVKEAISKQYPGAKIGECSTIDSPEFTGFEIALNDKGKKSEVQVTQDGKLKVSEESKGK